MNPTEPVITVVIPTRDRLDLVQRAIGCALSQTFTAIEVIVVIDGPNEAVLRALRQIDDPRMRTFPLPENVGTGRARNAGVNEARGEWIAFLDDDDEWFPEKLLLQLEAAQQSRHPWPVITCRLLARSETAEYVWPRRLPDIDEPLSEYLFCRTTPFWGEGVIQTSTILTKKELLRRVPFTEVRRLEDIDWVLRANAVLDARVEFVPVREPLSVWNREENRPRITNSPDWRYAYTWIKANKHLVTPRAFVSFLMTWVSASASRQGDWRALFMLLRESYGTAAPSAMDQLIFWSNWLLPRGLRNRISAVFSKSHRSGAGHLMRR